MELVTETAIARPAQMTRRGALDSCLVHIYPSGTAMGRRYPLGAGQVVLGREDGCEVRVPDGSVSRRHARIEPSPDGHVVRDLDSTNGTFVNDRPVLAPRILRDGDYLRVGNCIYRHLAGGNIEAEYHEEIYRLTILDGLTQVHNQRYLLEFLDRELARSRRHRRPLAVLMLDLDKFKAVNDAHGHLCGDHVLRAVSDRVRHAVRREDLFARYGGEEFCFVLVETNRPQAVEVAERVRAAVASGPVRYEAHALPVTVSIGVAWTDGGGEVTTADLLRAADDKLYEAKRAGRDRVEY